MLVPIIALLLVIIAIVYFIVSNAKNIDEGNRTDA
jgi:uncharacterized protein (UPF0333 family)